MAMCSAHPMGAAALNDYQANIDQAQLFLDNHWLSHARQSCAEALSLSGGASEVAALSAEIDHRLADPNALNLSRDHTPITVIMKRKCIISTLHFRDLQDDRLKQEAFRQGVYYIDVETSSQCNRKCNYCPNSVNDRLSLNYFMPESIYSYFISDLNLIDYAGDLHFVGYNEPMLHLGDLVGRIGLARKRLPRARLVVFTNGDYLKKAELEQLVAVGVDELIISVHLPVGRAYTDNEIFNRINKIAKRLETPIVPKHYIKDVTISARLDHPRIEINIRQTDYDHLGSNRAGTLDDIGQKLDVRTAACLMPIYQFIIGHKGAVVPCCVMVSDDPRNANYILGNISRKSTIFDIYSSRSFVEWRRGLFNLGPKAAPCDKCNSDVSTPLNTTPWVYEPWQDIVAPPLRSPLVLA
jgi:MoaA/NifB/PqqE/SkfB family radical SAM enzyme